MVLHAIVLFSIVPGPLIKIIGKVARDIVLPEPHIVIACHVVLPALAPLAGYIV